VRDAVVPLPVFPLAAIRPETTCDLLQALRGMLETLPQPGPEQAPVGGTLP
jgi:hypothetical protein